MSYRVLRDFDEGRMSYTPIPAARLHNLAEVVIGVSVLPQLINVTLYAIGTSSMPHFAKKHLANILW